jgi:RNA polymerase sigma factor (sigma-70 family)
MSMTEDQAWKLHREGDACASEWLVKRFTPLAKSIAHNLHKNKSVYGAFDYSDYHAEALLGLWKAIIKYDGRCNFSTYAYKVIHGAIIDGFRSLFKRSNEKYLSGDINKELEENDATTSFHSEFEEKEIIYEFEKQMENATEKDKFIYYCLSNELNINYISTKMNIGICQVYNLIKKFRDKYKKRLNNYIINYSNFDDNKIANYDSCDVIVSVNKTNKIKTETFEENIKEIKIAKNTRYKKYIPNWRRKCPDCGSKEYMLKTRRYIVAGSDERNKMTFYLCRACNRDSRNYDTHAKPKQRVVEQRVYGRKDNAA